MRIGFVGTGRMGNPMAQHLIRAGHQLTVHDLARRATTNLEEMGAQWAGSPRAAADGNELVFTSLPAPRDVEGVALGEQSILEGSAPGAVYVDLSTSSPSSIRRIHQVYGERGVAVLDAPVSGGVTGATSGTLAVLVGGDWEVYNRIKPVLDAIGDKVMYCGPIGNGMVCKICNNLVSMGLIAFLAEALTLGVKAGVELETLVEAISKSSGSNRPLAEKLPRGLFQGNFDPGFTLALGSKDVRLATELGRELGLPMEISNLFDQKFVEAMARGWSDRDVDIVATMQEERTGVRLRTRQR